jgi:hypothetical protein
MAVEAFERNKDLLVIIGRDAHSVVGKGNQTLPVSLRHRLDTNFQWTGRLAIFDRVADQILKKLGARDRVDEHRG